MAIKDAGWPSREPEGVHSFMEYLQRGRQPTSPLLILPCLVLEPAWAGREKADFMGTGWARLPLACHVRASEGRVLSRYSWTLAFF